MYGLSRRLSKPIRQIGCVLLSLFPVLVILGNILHAEHASDAARAERQCISNCKQLGFGMLQYAQDWDETLPPSSQWATAIEKQIPKAEVWHCPAATLPYSYACSKEAGNLALSNVYAPATTVLLFEMDATIKNASGGPQDIVKSRRHFSDGNNYGLMDGHVKWVSDRGVINLRWQPMASDVPPPSASPTHP